METPLIVCELLIQRMTPEMKVDVPRVTMRESSPSRTMIAPLMIPTSRPIPIAAAIDMPIDQP